MSNKRLDMIEKRKAAGLSQAAIGEMAKLSQTYVSRFEIGKSLADEHIAALTAVYDKLEPAPAGETKPPNREKKTPKMKRKARDVKKEAEPEEDDPILDTKWERFDEEWRAAQVKAWVSDNDFTIVESGKTGVRHIMVPMGKLEEFIYSLSRVFRHSS